MNGDITQLLSAASAGDRDSLDRVFDVLNLFSVAKPLWTVDEATAALKHSRSTVYRYIRTLVKAGLLASVGRSYGLGPRIV